MWPHTTTTTRYTGGMAPERVNQHRAEEFTAELAKILDTAMHERRVTTLDVAEDTGVNRQTVGRIRRGEAAPDLHTAMALAGWCGYRVRPVRDDDQPPGGTP